MIGRIAAFGRLGLDIVSSFGRSGRFLAGVLGGVPRPATGFPLLVKQLYAVGVLSLAIIVVSGLFIGMVLGLQGYTILSDYGSEAAIGQMIALTLVRELGPVVTALLFAGRAGSALTAEIGLMKATEQLSSMEMMGVDRLGVFEGSFWGNMQSSVDFVDDVLNGVIKSVVFGFVCAWIAVYQGYDCVPTSAGISSATTKTVVYSSLAVLGLDFVLTAVMFGDF